MESMKGYISLQEYVSTVSRTLRRSDDEGDEDLNLVKFLEGIQQKSWLDMKALLSKLVISSLLETHSDKGLYSDLMAAAETIGWPSVVDYNSQPVENRKAFETSFFKLLKLQNMCASVYAICIPAKLITMLGAGRYTLIFGLVKRTAIILFRPLFSRLQRASSTISRAHDKQTS